MKVQRSPASAAAPRVSVVLPCWSARRRFPLLSFLRTQTLPRDEFEVLLVEYHDRDQSRRLAPISYDACVSLGRPRSEVYHKGILYNVGLALARAEVVVFCTPDVMVRPTFLEDVLRQLEVGESTALLYSRRDDLRRGLFPFRESSFEAFSSTRRPRAGGDDGDGDGSEPLLHRERDFRTCLAARRRDLLEIGGAEEAPDYRGYIGGVYEMAIRLRNKGVTIRWNRRERLYHTWHPGQGGGAEYLGPRIPGTHLAPASVIASVTGRRTPWSPSPLVAACRNRRSPLASDDLPEAYPRPADEGWILEAGGEPAPDEISSRSDLPPSWTYRGYLMYRTREGHLAVPALVPQLGDRAGDLEDYILRAADRESLQELIDRASGPRTAFRATAGAFFFFWSRVYFHIVAVLGHAWSWIHFLVSRTYSVLERLTLRVRRRLERSQKVARWVTRPLGRVRQAGRNGPVRVAASLRRLYTESESRAQRRLKEIAEAQEIASRLSVLEEPGLRRWLGPRRPLVVGSSRVRSFLRFLQFFGLAPRGFEVYSVPPDTSVHDLLSRICAETDCDEVFVESSLLSRHPDFLGSQDLPKKVILV